MPCFATGGKIHIACYKYDYAIFFKANLSICRRYIKRQDLNIAVLDEILEEVLPTFIGRVAIIKIDVEGFEPFVFLGAQKLLNIVHPPAIMTEVSLATKGGTEQYVKYVSGNITQ